MAQTQKSVAAAPLPVLFTHFGDECLRGSENVLLDLLRNLDRRRFHPVVWCNSETMAEAARGLGCPTYRSDFSHALDYSSPPLSIGRYLRLFREARALCRSHGIRVIHANSGAPAQWLVPAGLCERLPVVVHLHANYWRRSRFVLLLHAATLAIGVSQRTLGGLADDGMAPSRTRVVYNGIDPARLLESGYDLRASLGIGRDALVIATCGSLVAGKAHDVLIRAFADLPDQATARLLVAGEGSDRVALTKLACSLGVGGRVHFLGNRDDVASVYRAADVFALASRQESFGLALAEAGLFGLPVVASNVGGIPEVVADEETGLLVPADDVAAFSLALGRLGADPALRARLGAAGRARVGQMFNATRMAEQFEAVYEGLAAIQVARLGWRSLFARLEPYARLIWPGRGGARAVPDYANASSEYPLAATSSHQAR